MRFLSVHNDDYSRSVERSPTQGPYLKIMTKRKDKQTWQEVKYMVKKDLSTAQMMCLLLISAIKEQKKLMHLNMLLSLA